MKVKEDKLYELVFEHFCKNYDWFLVGKEKPKLVFMENKNKDMKICFYLYGGKIHWGKDFFYDVIGKYTGNTNLSDYRAFLKRFINDFFISPRGWRLFEAGVWNQVNYTDCVISRSNRFLFAEKEMVPYVRNIPK